MNEQPDVAYYYPPTFWRGRDSSWVKSLLLFFDELAILLPDYMYGSHMVADPALVIPLQERGLLRVLEPNDWIDEETAESLAEMMADLLTTGAFDELPKDVPFRELSQSRIGYGVDVGLADMLVEELEAKGLARPSEDGDSIPLHPSVRTTILVILGQLSRAAGARKGLNVHPVANDPQAVVDLIQTLSIEPMPSADNTITLDLEAVSFDLTLVPLDEVLAFREEHKQSHRAYVRDLHRFMAELANIDNTDDRERLRAERHQEIAEAARVLRRPALHWLDESKDRASFSIGLAGAAWSARGGFDPVGLALSAAGMASQLISGRRPPITAYSYIFAVDREFGNH